MVGAQHLLQIGQAAVENIGRATKQHTQEKRGKNTTTCRKKKGKGERNIYVAALRIAERERDTRAQEESVKCVKNTASCGLIPLLENLVAKALDAVLCAGLGRELHHSTVVQKSQHLQNRAQLLVDTAADSPNIIVKMN